MGRSTTRDDAPTPRQRRPKISDIAARTGLSTATISRTINGKRWVSAETRARVQAALEEVGYVPSGIAASLRTGRTGLLCLMIGELRDPTALAAMQGALEAASAARYGVVVHMTHDASEHSHFYSDVIGRGWVDGGLLLWPTSADASLIQHIYEGGMPLVLIEPEIEVPNVPSVHSDAFDVGFRSTQHLLELGHRRIAICAQPPGAWDIGVRYLDGCNAALAAANIPGASSCEYAYGGTYADGYEAARTWLQRTNPPTGLCFNSDLSALGGMAAAHDLRLSIPHDVSVVGYDDTEIAQLIKPSLTTPRLRFLGMARAACELLIGLMNGSESTPTPQFIQTDIVARESTSLLQHR